jgi:hypothetical protein
MTLKDGLKMIGRPAEIPDCNRDDLPQFFVDMGFKTGAEIGVYKGEYSEKFAKVGLKHYAIDPWLMYSDYLRNQPRLDFQFEHTQRVLSPYPNCTIIRKTSMDALADFPDESLDYVYIDGNHHFRYVAEDIAEWHKKVKVGGAVCGHDYFYARESPPGRCLNICHVRYVLDAYVAAYNIPNFYVLGRKETILGEKRDQWRSWMWIKSISLNYIGE